MKYIKIDPWCVLVFYLLPDGDFSRGGAAYLWVKSHLIGWIKPKPNSYFQSELFLTFSSTILYLWLLFSVWSADCGE